MRVLLQQDGSFICKWDGASPRALFDLHHLCRFRPGVVTRNYVIGSNIVDVGN